MIEARMIDVMNRDRAKHSLATIFPTLHEFLEVRDHVLETAPGEDGSPLRVETVLPPWRIPLDYTENVPRGL